LAKGEEMIIAMLFLVLSSSTPAAAQFQVQTPGYHIEYTLHGVHDTMAWLCEVRGKEVHAIDSSSVHHGAVVFTGDDSLPHGVYKIVFNDTLFTDIVFTGEHIRLESRLPDIVGNMVVHGSVENALLFGYWQYFFRIQDTLDDVIRRGRELYYQTQGRPSRALDALQARADELEQVKHRYILEMKRLHPDRFAPRLIWSFQQPDYRMHLLNGGRPYSNEKEYYKHHFFDRLDFSDPRMIHSEVLYVMINDYLRTFSLPASSENYVELTGVILEKARAHPVVYQYCLDLLVSNFSASIWEPVFLYLVEEHYLTAPLANSSLKASYARKAEAIRRTSIGSRIPEICGQTPDGKRHCLYGNLGTRTLVMIWSLGCDHCESMLPGIQNISNEYAEKGLRVFSFTLAENKDSLAAAMDEHGIGWINVSDYKGFLSGVIDEFNVTVTPLIFLVDEKGIITDKPTNIPVIYANLVVRYRDQ